MIGLVTLSGLCLLSGLLVERRFSVDSLLERIVVVFSVGTAQLLLSVQLLSLQEWLSSLGLIIVNGVLLALVYGLMRHRRGGEARRSWNTLIVSARNSLKVLRAERMLLVSGIAVTLFIGLSWVMGVTVIPYGDGYHFDMPIFWSQHRTIMPFEAPNPRVVTVAFVSEALSLPGYLYCQTDKMIAVLTLLAAALCIWLVFSIARRVGCSVVAAGFSAILTAGYTPFALSFIFMRADFFLAMMWSGACILFLLDACPPGDSRYRLRNLGWSVLCFALACGTKNTCSLSGPLVLFSVIMILRRFVPRAETWYRLIIVGGIAVICSGVAWNYASNKLWFDDLKGPPFMQEVTSTDFQPGSVWTRLTRGAIMFLYDPTWVPKSAENAYSTLCAKSLALVGSVEQIAEDAPFYELKKTDMLPRLGFGLLGIFVFVPGVTLGLLRCVGIDRQTNPPADSVRLKTGLLVLMTGGTFVVTHMMLRCQSIGLFRLIPFFLMAGAPLTAPLLEKLTSRIGALVLLALSGVIFLMFNVTNVTRRLELHVEDPTLERIIQPRNSHEGIIEYTAVDNSIQRTVMDDGNVVRNLSLMFLARIKTSPVIGFIGGPNSELYYLFGKDFNNLIVPLTDARNPNEIHEPSAAIEFIVFCDDEGGSRNGTSRWDIDGWTTRHGLAPIFRATRDGKCIFAAFKRES